MNDPKTKLMKHLSHLNKYFYKYRWRFLLGMIFVIISNYFRVLQPQVIRYALDLVIDNVSFYNLYEGFQLQDVLQGELGTTLLMFGATVSLLAILMGIFMYFMRQTIIVMSRLIEFDLRNEIFEHYTKLTLGFYKKNNTGDMMARVSEDVSKVRMYLGPAMLYTVNLVGLVVMTVWAMLSVSVEMTLYVLIPLPILSFSIYYVSMLINKRSEVIQQQLATLNSTAQEVYSGIRVVKSYVQEAPMTRFFRVESNEYKDKSMDLVKIEALFFPLMLLLIGASTILTIWIGGQQVAKGNITAGNIAEFIIYVNMLTWPVTSIGWVASIIQTAAASQKRINEFLYTTPDIEQEKTKPFELQGNIEFKNVLFTYPDTGITAIKNLSFKLNKGERMAIIGRTGCGKTTIADLILRMYDITEGEILIDGKDIKDIDLAGLRQSMGYVPQDVFLFSNTVSKNISFGKENATQEEIERYANYAAIDKEIKGLPKGYKTIVGERGVTLSGGQKQRISIARAFIKQPNMIILDDCLSAVDTNTEQQILGYLDNELSDKTAIIITHRIYGLLEFDKILVLEDGLIAEMGTHEELLKNGGYYAELYQKQQEE